MALNGLKESITNDVKKCPNKIYLPDIVKGLIKIWLNFQIV
jgi:hypothetical protein